MGEDREILTGKPDRHSPGTDIERIDRFRELDRNEHMRFFSRIFTERELRYSRSKEDPAPHLAVRFAAKEAGVKALAGLGRHGVDYRSLEILNESSGAPRLVLRDPSLDDLSAEVSLSHSGGYAQAFVIVSLRDKRKSAT